MALIHPTAIVSDSAVLGANVEVGPYSIVGPKVKLADGVKLYSHVAIDGLTEIGENTEVFPFASLGHRPQDKKFNGEATRLVIGARNVIREHVTMNPGTEGGGAMTQVGNDCLFMASSHVAHDCTVGNNVILANNATLAGHVTVGDFVILGGLSAVHQFARIGAHAFVGGMTGVTADVIPYGMVTGNRASLSGLNLVGLKRRNVEREHIHALRRAYKELFLAGTGTLHERARTLRETYTQPEAAFLLDFVLAESDRAFCTPKKATRASDSEDE